MIATIVAVGIVAVASSLAVVWFIGRFIAVGAGKHKARARDDRWDA